MRSYTKVLKAVERYFNKNLPQYEVVEVMRKSNHPSDDYLYMVIAATTSENPKYACWTCWNDSTESLHYGHYNLPTYVAAKDVCRYYYNDTWEGNK